MHIFFTLVFMFQQIYIPIVFIEPTIIEQLRNHPDQQRIIMIYSAELSSVAEEHACDMANRNYFGHVNPEGIGPNERARRAGIPIPSWYGQTLDANQIESIALAGNADRALELWLESPGHRTHVLGEHEFYANQIIVGYGECENRYVFLSYEREE